MSHNMKAIASQLRQAGYRVTPQRQIILDAICLIGGHVTPEMVFNQVQTIAPTLSRATIYRSLHFLSEQNILTRTQMPDGHMGYEIANEEPHHHLVCRGCDHSVEIQHAELAACFQEIDAKHRFWVDMDHLSLYGLCEHCQS